MFPENVISSFKSVFNNDPLAFFFAPGRVNLIGEHIDYNGGLVFPCAISLGTYAAVRPRQDRLFKVYSCNFTKNGVTVIDPDELTIKTEGNWTNYVKGVLSALSDKKDAISFGLEICIYGDLPNGSGLSSSASLEMLLLQIFNTYYHLALSPVDMAYIGKKVENEYIGVNSGIMDQFAIALGKKDAALVLDCATAKYKHIPFNLSGYKLIIMNTNKKRQLADSKYNERFAQCQKALSLLKSSFNIDHLCDLKTEQLKDAEAILNDPVLYKRVAHTVTENQRVHEAISALNNGDIITFGNLLTASHRSLQKDYDVTGTELDTLVDSALKNGSLGARMTGAGFGGCAICLVEDSKKDLLITETAKAYKAAIGYDASFYEVTTSDAPMQLTLN